MFLVWFFDLFLQAFMENAVVNICMHFLALLYYSVVLISISLSPLLPLIPPQGPLSPDDYSDLYNNLRAWVDEKAQLVKTKDFPLSTGDLRQEIKVMEGVKKEIITTKKKDMATASNLHDQLVAQHNKKASNPGVPEGEDFPPLQEVLSCVIAIKCNNQT